MKKEIWFYRLLPVGLTIIVVLGVVIVTRVPPKQDEPVDVVDSVQQESNVTYEPVVGDELAKRQQEILETVPDVVQPEYVEADMDDKMEEYVMQVGDLYVNYFNSRGLPVSSYRAVDCFTVGGNTQAYIEFTNTNAVTYVLVDASGELIGYDTPSPIDGSDYAVIYFENGVPDNIEQIQQSTLDNRLFSWYVSDYSGGETITLTDGSTNEVFTIMLE